VVVDRYWLSTVAYGAEMGAAFDLSSVERQLAPADLTVFLHAPPSVRRSRMLGRGRPLSGHDWMSLDAARSRSLADRYRAAAKGRVAGRFLPVDVSSRRPDEVVRHVLGQVDARELAA